MSANKLEKYLYYPYINFRLIFNTRSGVRVLLTIMQGDSTKLVTRIKPLVQHSNEPQKMLVCYGCYIPFTYSSWVYHRKLSAGFLSVAGRMLSDRSQP